MSDKVLVAYGSKYGSTAEIAEAIAKTLREAGFDVEVASAEVAGDVGSYRAVVLGSGVYAGNWRKEAVEFLEAKQSELAERPVWLFSSGPTGDGDPLELLDGWRFPEAQKPIADRIGPRDMAVFHGNIDVDKLNFGEKLIVKAVKGQFGDSRDWDAIRDWASGIAKELSG